MMSQMLYFNLHLSLAMQVSYIEIIFLISQWGTRFPQQGTSFPNGIPLFPNGVSRFTNRVSCFPNCVPFFLKRVTDFLAKKTGTPGNQLPFWGNGTPFGKLGIPFFNEMEVSQKLGNPFKKQVTHFRKLVTLLGKLGIQLRKPGTTFGFCPSFDINHKKFRKNGFTVPSIILQFWFSKFVVKGRRMVQHVKSDVREEKQK